MSVMTVTGPVAAGELGRVLPHEHLIACFATPDDTTGLDRSEEGRLRLARARPVPATDAAFYAAPVEAARLGALNLGAPNRDNETLDEQCAVGGLTEFAEHGGGAVVDATARGRGRDAAALRRVALRTGVGVVMGAGWHHPAWSPEIAGRDAASLAAEITGELRSGVEVPGHSPVRAGIIGRVGALDPEEPAELPLLRAVAIAASETGAPVSIQAAADSVRTHAMLDVLAAEGAELSRVAVGGCGALARDLPAIESLLARGVFANFDALGRIPTVRTEISDHRVATTVIELAARGHAERLLLSPGIERKADLTAYGGNGHAFLAQQFVPYLRLLGADEALIDAVTLANPQRLLDPAEARS